MVFKNFRYARSSGGVQNHSKHCSVGKNQDDYMTFIRGSNNKYKITLDIFLWVKSKMAALGQTVSLYFLGPVHNFEVYYIVFRHARSSGGVKLP